MKNAMQVLYLLVLSAVCLAQQQQYQQTTPVPILKQINRQNDDGSYSFGYEAADGSFKIETKYANGDVAGKYGYVDENGKAQEVEYGASSKRGFEPQGNGINVPPPTLDDGNNALTPGSEDDGQYREDPSIYYKDPKYNQTPKTASRPAINYRLPAPQPQPQQPIYEQQQNNYRPLTQAPSFQPGYQSQVYRSQPQFTFQQSLRQPNDNQLYQPQQYSQPQYNQPQPQPQYSQPQPQPQYNQLQYSQQPQYNQQSQFDLFNGHPAQNFDINTGSYSISFTG